MSHTSFQFCGESFTPSADGAVFRENTRELLVADLHFEKASYFASRRGQMLPPYETLETLDRLQRDIAIFSPSAVVCLGDSFHDENAFGRLPAAAAEQLHRMTTQSAFLWIGGNHDALTETVFGITVGEAMQSSGIVYRHQARVTELAPEITGHYHPKLYMSILGRRISRKCVAQGATKLILPAYGTMTGGLDVASAEIINICNTPAKAHVWTKRGVKSFGIPVHR